MASGRKPRWTEQQLWDAVRRAASRTDRLTTVAYEALRRPDDPSVATVITRLGSSIGGNWGEIVARVGSTAGHGRRSSRAERHRGANNPGQPARSLPAGHTGEVERRVVQAILHLMAGGSPVRGAKVAEIAGVSPTMIFTCFGTLDDAISTAVNEVIEAGMDRVRSADWCGLRRWIEEEPEHAKVAVASVLLRPKHMDTLARCLSVPLPVALGAVALLRRRSADVWGVESSAYDEAVRFVEIWCPAA